MRRAKYFGAAAVMAAFAAVFISCPEAGETLGVDGGVVTTGNYTITVNNGEAGHGVITTNRSKADKNDKVIIKAIPAEASAWEGDGEKSGGGGESPELFPWYIKSLDIKPKVTYKKTAANEWEFSMPAADVTISAVFSQTPVVSNYLVDLGVNLPAVITPKFSSETTYIITIPHIFPVPVIEGEEEADGDIEANDDDEEGLTFNIVAVQEDPNAEITITNSANADEDLYGVDIPLTEGKKDYVITVSRPEVLDLTPPEAEPRKYNLTVNYEPDITLKSITLTSSGDANWSRNLLLQDEQTVNLPPNYGSINIAAETNTADVTLTAVHSGAGTFSGGGTPWTLTYEGAGEVLSSKVELKVSKTVDDETYNKVYTVNILRSADTSFPQAMWAEGGAVEIIKNGEWYDEVHTFMASEDDFIWIGGDAYGDITARVLVVAGGGGGGGGGRKDADGGGGGGGGGVAYAGSLSISTLANGTIAVVVGAGGKGGGGNNVPGSKGKPGNLSSLSVKNGNTIGNTIITVSGGGGGGGGQGSTNDSRTGTSDGLSGGSGGGGGGGGAQVIGKGGKSTPVTSQDDWLFCGKDGNDGTAGSTGGAGGSSGLKDESSDVGFINDISGTSVEYAKGGSGGDQTSNAVSGGNNTGNGGGGGKASGSGGNGGSGIVIIRFPAKRNSGSSS
ncbi:MAG: hypothetical protein LBC27_01630 [Spirochaetaceae bacterium]|jgi:hypothetical protein|nr:hypothetical protein [Spirochaetaceae bacterium]